MSFRINTNIASLQAQEYLRMNSDNQSKTINRVTSGLRIVSSGDDAAGLAIANGFRSDQAVLSQGIRNANDGLSTLQTIDGGINNISKLLDRARTLATQSASGTFTGDRGVLNNEFKSVMEEIDRQAQAIGLDTGGQFAKSLSVFIGGGKDNTTTAIQNGSVAVDLTNSRVDTQSLGLTGFQAKGAASGGLQANSSTSVKSILANTTNTNGLNNTTSFTFAGAGFSDDKAVKVDVNFSGVESTSAMVDKINDAIKSAGADGTAFYNAGIRAVVSNTDGVEQIAFTSSSSTFQVRANDRVSNALIGNFSGGNGAAVNNTATVDTNTGAGYTVANGDTVKIRFSGGGLADAVTISLTNTSGGTWDSSDLVTALTNQVASNSALQAAGFTIDATGFTDGGTFTVGNKNGGAFTVEAAGDVNNVMGLGGYRLGNSSEFDYTSVTAAAPGAATNASSMRFSVGSSAFDITVAATAGGVQQEVIDAINAGFAADSSGTAQKFGFIAQANGANIEITTKSGSVFRMWNTDTDNAGFGVGSTDATTTGVSATASAKHTVNVSGAYATAGSADSSGILNFANILSGNDDQTISITATDATGAQQSLSVTLQQALNNRSGASIDEALNAINDALQNSNNSTLQKLVAVKETDDNSTTQGIRFMGPVAFKVSVGASGGTSPVGITDGSAQEVESATSRVGTTSAVDISTEETAKQAVTALADAVATLGNAQAVVGKGQNQFNYAIGLASTQLTNIAAAESRIRDADLAEEAANLTKAQIILQAGIAALSQANSAPQAVLSLLRG